MVWLILKQLSVPQNRFSTANTCKRVSIGNYLGMLFAILLLQTAPITSIAADHSKDAPDNAVKEWTVPWSGSRPRDPFVDPKGRVWFCGQVGNYLAYLDPTTGQFKRYDLRRSTHPHNLIIDSSGQVWYAGNRNAHIGRLDPDSGKITEYPMPEAGVDDPHTLVFGKSGSIWFTAQSGNRVGHLDMRTGKIRLLKTGLSHSRPYGIKVAKNGRPWIVLFGSHHLATVDPSTFEPQRIPLPRKDARPRRLEVDSSGQVWYVDYRGGMLGRYQPDSGQFTEWPLPSGKNARPYGTALDQRNRIWIAETGPHPNTLVAFDPRSESFTDGISIPSGAGTIRHMYFHPQDNSIWFGTDANTVGRIRVSDN